MAIYLVWNRFKPAAVAATDGGSLQGMFGLQDLPFSYYFMKYSAKLVRNFMSLIDCNKALDYIEASCINIDNYKEVTGELANNAEWKGKYNCNPTQTEFLDMKNDCCATTSKLFKIAPTLVKAPKPIMYHVCPATNYCAAKRQVTAVPEPDDKMLNLFGNWFSNKIMPEIEVLLLGYRPSYEEWFNHLTYKQQVPLRKIKEVVDSSVWDKKSIFRALKENKIDTSTDYSMFVKSEKQLYDNGTAPKNRCICSPNSLHKFVLGPITWSLEHVFKNFDGYCGGKNWDQLEDLYNDWEDKGFTNVLQLDGSGFDRTQHQAIKNIVDQQIYKLVAHYVEHVPMDMFLEFALAETRKVRLSHRTNKQLYNDGFFTQTGAVFSGSCDTTLMNTIRMAVYNRFVNECLLNLHYGSDYEVIAKGDDTAAAYASHILKYRVQQAYDKVFVSGISSSKYLNLKHGLGQIAKYYHWGGIDSIDFCSTQTFYAPSINSYKIIRQLPRFFTLTAWSRNISGFNSNQIACYLESLYQSNLCWMSGFPILRVYNALLHRDCTGMTYKTISGKKKQILYEGQPMPDYLQSNDLHHACHCRRSSKIPSYNDYCQFLFDKYHITSTDIDIIESDIMRHHDGEIDSPLLSCCLGLTSD